MAGYSGTPLVDKLGVRAGQRVLVLGRPHDVDLQVVLAPLPDLATLDQRAAAGRDDYDVVVAFCPDRAGLTARLPSAISRIVRSGAVWVVWPKKSGPRYAGGTRGITEDDVRRAALAAGVVDVKVCAFDEVWSALKLVYRRSDR